MKDKKNNSTTKIIPIFIENYLSISKTFIYRQVEDVNVFAQKIVLVSSELENLDIFPHQHIYSQYKNVFELLFLKFYEKVLRDRFFFSFYRVLSYRQKKYFSKILDDPRIKFIHAHFGTAALEIFKIAQKLDKKLLISFHGIDASNLLGSESYRNNLKKFFHSSIIIVPSIYMKKRLEKEINHPEKTYVVHYGIPIQFYKYVERKDLKEKMTKSEKISFLQVSNFVEKKGHLYTLRAFAKLLSTFTNVRLILAGDGPLRKEIERETKILKIESSVQFLGRVNQEQVKDLFLKADVFLHHSITAKNGDQEGIPNVIMEAMATGLPVISTYHSGIPELINDGVNGFLVPEKDIERYRSKMEMVLFNTDRKVSQNARKTIEMHFNLEVQLKKLNDIYQHLFE